MIRLILIEDHILVRQALCLLLADIPEIQVIGQASTGAEGVQLVRKLNPDVVILDLKLPDISGLEVTIRLLHFAPRSKILMLSSLSHHEFVQRILMLGASGYLTKEASREELISAIKAVHKGQIVISPAVAHRLASAKIDHKTTAIFSALTHKELEVLMLSVRNISASKIAQQLWISTKTVHSYRTRLFQKLGVDNVIALMLLAVREGLMTLEETGQ